MLTPCVGRDEVLDRLRSLLGSNQWVTLTGAPGCGKTLVARHVAQSATATAWVSGHTNPTADTLVTACLDALAAEVAPGDSTAMALKRALDGRDLLLVLDGVDSIDGLGGILNDVVEDAETFRLLCTATTVAGQPHENVLRLQPLSVPSASEPLEGAAVELLLSRVAAAGGHTVDVVQHDRTLRRLLRASGGLPSLIEQLAVQIALIGVSDVAPAGTMAQAIRVSYDLLDDDQRRCFRRLAVIGRPVGLDVLADICQVSRPEVVQLASALARRSLVEVHSDGRFDMLPPLREVGRELARDTADEAEAMEGLLRWVDRTIPTGYYTGAGNAPWLSEVPLVAVAVRHAAADDARRPEAYELANRAFSALYTAMRARDAVDLLESVLDSGDGPASIGSQLARRAGICASEVRGTYDGLRLLDRAEQHASGLEETARDLELARNAAIRAEMHLDAGNLAQARADAERTLRLSQDDPYVVRQVRRTLMDVCVASGDLAEAERLGELIVDSPPADEVWLALSARTLQAKIAWEQGRLVEAESLALYALAKAQELHEDRIALLADSVARLVTGRPGADLDVDPEALPWAVRVVVQLQEARDLLVAGDLGRAAGRAADTVVLADSARLGRDGVEGRLLVADALMATGDPAQARPAYLAALVRACDVPMPLRAADALDGLAASAEAGTAAYRQLAGAAAALRAPRGAVGRERPGVPYAAGSPRDCPSSWVSGGHLTPAGLAAVSDLTTGDEPEVASPLGVLTRAERAVAELVAEGLTSRQIAEKLFISPRTVDAHLSHIFRKLEISTRARLAALMAEVA